MKKKWLWILPAAVVFLGGGFFFLKGNGAEKTTYRCEKVDRGDIILSITATGTLQADTTVQVGSQVSGRIARLFADFNSVVKKGQVLAQLDPTFLQAALDQAKAGVARARASLNQADRDHKRMSDLFGKNLISQADMDASVTAFESAQANLQQAQAALQGALVNLRYATITSPISGVVISRNVDVGQTVAASLQAWDDNDFTIRSQSDIASAATATSSIMTVLLGSIASVSLIVGGIGIMNIMLVSVTERTREIGIRMSIGARRSDILLQFLIEAMALSVLGGLIGVALGLGTSTLISKFAGWPVFVSPGAVGLAFFFSALVGVFFGFYPARKAAALSPIEALRHE